MREHTVKDITHIVYESKDEIPTNLVYLPDWKDGDVGDWVLADDGCIIQVLRVGYFTRPTKKVKALKYVGTCTGTFICKESYKMDCEKRDNIYNISGKSLYSQTVNREAITQKERLFAEFVSQGMERTEAYLRAFTTKSRHHAQAQAGLLLKQERVRSVMKAELKPVLAKLGINDTMVLQGIKDVAVSGEKDSDKLKALFELAAILEIKETRKEITAIGGAVFKGFLPEDAEVLDDRKQLLEGKDNADI
tara:strand:- start:2123 stop:2869 length:747 start_codon:yes stop_codon:yes gene_type:complete